MSPSAPSSMGDAMARFLRHSLRELPVHRSVAWTARRGTADTPVEELEDMDDDRDDCDDMLDTSEIIESGDDAEEAERAREDRRTKLG